MPLMTDKAVETEQFTHFQGGTVVHRLHISQLLECLTAACKTLSLANAKGKSTNGLVIRSLDD